MAACACTAPPVSSGPCMRGQAGGSRWKEPVQKAGDEFNMKIIVLVRQTTPRKKTRGEKSKRDRGIPSVPRLVKSNKCTGVMNNMILYYITWRCQITF